VSESGWAVRVTATARRDFEEIVQWTEQRFGASQARLYARTLSDAIAALMHGPETLGMKRREDIGDCLYTLHVARNKRRGRHFLLCRIGGERVSRVLDLLRILYDAMDLPRHLPVPGRDGVT
jgi:toxin ParE1/3/4